MNEEQIPARSPLSFQWVVPSISNSSSFAIRPSCSVETHRPQSTAQLDAAKVLPQGLSFFFFCSISLSTYQPVRQNRDCVQEIFRRTAVMVENYHVVRPEPETLEPALPELEHWSEWTQTTPPVATAVSQDSSTETSISADHQSAPQIRWGSSDFIHKHSSFSLRLLLQTP